MIVIAYYTALKYLRSIPLILFFVLGTVGVLYITTSGAMGDYKQLDGKYREKVGFLCDDNGTSAALFKGFISSDKMKKLIELKIIKKYDAGIAEIKNGEIESFIYIAKGFSKQAESGGKSEITVLSSNKVSVAKTLAEGFINTNNSVKAIISTGGNPEQEGTSANLDSSAIDSKGRVPGQRDAASVSCMIVMMFYCALLASYSMITDANKRTVLRLKTAPIRYTENIIGKIAGVTFVITVYEVIIILITKYALGVSWNGNIAVISLSLILFNILISSFGILVASFSKNIFICGLITFVVNMSLVYSVQAKAYAPGSGNAFDFALVISPHNYAYEAIIGSIYSGTASNVPASLAVLAATAVVLAAISTAVGRRRTV